MLHQARALAGPVSGLGALNGALLQAARSDQPVNIARGSAWSFMWTGWQRPTRQHDAAEFLQHLCQRTDCTALRGGWEARTQQERAYEIVDEQFTCLHSRLPLQRPFQIQEAIQQWHNHEAVHAVTSAPDLLILSFHIQRRIEVPTFVGHAGAIEHTIHAVWWCPAHRQSGQWSLQATTKLFTFRGIMMICGHSTSSMMTIKSRQRNRSHTSSHPHELLQEKQLNIAHASGQWSVVSPPVFTQSADLRELFKCKICLALFPLLEVGSRSPRPPGWRRHCTVTLHILLLCPSCALRLSGL